MENWKSIAGYEGLYEISDRGNVRSLNFKHTGKTKILKFSDSRDGYFRVTFCKEGIRRNMFVHRLVAEAFIPNTNKLETVNHKDEDKHNNNVSNLEWMSRADNLRYGTRIKRAADALSKPVQKLDKSTGKLLATFPSTQEAERVTGISQSSIAKCCLGKLKSAGGYVWRYF